MQKAFSCLIVCLLTLSFVCHAHAQSSPPNIVLIMVDDLGYGDLGSYGAPDMQTPHLDGLLAKGMRFDQFYANCTVCSPTRASLMTGLFPDKAGVPGVIRQQASSSWGFLDPDAKTLPDMLKQAGYHTALVGKWHLGLGSPNTPNERGFDHFHGFLGDMMNDYYNHLRGGKNWMRLNHEEVTARGRHATEVFSDWAIQYLEKRSTEKDKPFFLFLSYNAPHFPIQPPQAWLQKVREREPELSLKRAANVAFIEHMDDEIGRVLERIEQLGIAEETLIIFTSDNGGALRYEQRNLPLKGGKQEHWEGGIRVPTFVVWPGKVPAGQSDELGMTMDLYPTLCEIAGVEIDHEIDGQSLAPIWLENKTGDPQRVMIWVRREGGKYNGQAYYAIRKGDWKMMQNQPDQPFFLIDLKNDPLEQRPIPADTPIARELKTRLMQHIQEAGRVPWQE